MVDQLPLVVLGTSPNWTGLSQLKVGDRLAGVVNHVDFGNNSVVISGPTGAVFSEELTANTVLANLGAGASAVTLTALAAAISSASRLSDLSDVSADNPVAGDTLVYDGTTSEFKPVTNALDNLADVTTASKTEGALLAYDPTTDRWRPQADAPRDDLGYVRRNGQWHITSADSGTGGYELTGGFSARVNASGQTGANDFGTFVGYTQEMVDADQWLRFGMNPTAQAANDVAYWTDPDPNADPAFDQTKGLFGGAHLPPGVDALFDFSFDEPSGYSAEALGQSLNYTAATGSLDFTTALVGDLALVRFDFNIIPQVANTTIEVGIIWETRDDQGNPTFTFPLTGTPIFYGAGSVGNTFLNRPTLSAYFASNEDVNARALLAIKSDNPVQVAPLTTLVIINR